MTTSRVAGDILVQLAGLCEAKTDVLWEDWQDAHNADGPVMGEGWLQGLTRQTQELDFSELVQRSYQSSGDRLNEDKTDEDSVAGDVEKLSVLDMIDALEDADLKSQASAVSHAENVSDWVEALADKQVDSPQRLVDSSAAAEDAVDRSVDRGAVRWVSDGAARQFLPNSGSLGGQV